jgi:hypothetical protein
VAVVTTEAALVMTKAAEQFFGWITSKALANKDARDRKKVCLNYQERLHQRGFCGYSCHLRTHVVNLFPSISTARKRGDTGNTTSLLVSLSLWGFFFILSV